MQCNHPLRAHYGAKPFARFSGRRALLIYMCIHNGLQREKTSPLKETGCIRGRDIWERPGKPLSERLVRKGVAVKMTRRIPHASTIAQFGAHVDVGNHVQGEKLHYLELQ